MVRGAPVLMVGPDPGVVERELTAGELSCPACSGELRPWGHARRWLRDRATERVVRLRRGRCRSCLGTLVLLPVVTLGRRLDLAGVIGAALVAKAAGVGIGGSPPPWACPRRRCGAGCAGSPPEPSWSARSSPRWPTPWTPS